MCKVENKENFFKDLLILSVPMMIQNFLSSSLNLVDNIMIGNVGESAIAATGIGNQVFFLFLLISYGITSGSSIFISQFWGKKDMDNLGKIIGIGLALNFVLGILFFLGGQFLSKEIIGLFIKDKDIIRLGSEYLKIVSFGYIFSSITFVYAHGFRSIGETKIPMYVTTICLIINTILNYTLIYGKFGFHPMGVKGAAIATIVSRLIEVILFLLILFKQDRLPKGNLKNINLNFMKKYLRVTIPVILNEGTWALGHITYMIIYGYMGKAAVAAMQVSNTIENMFFVVIYGIGNGASILIGKKIGKGDRDLAYDYGVKIGIVIPVVGGLFGVILWMAGPLIVRPFNLSSVSYGYTMEVLVCMSFLMCIKFFDEIMIGGVFRSGGDTEFSLWIDLGGIWLIAVPLGFIGVIMLKLPLWSIYLLISFEEIIEVFLAIHRLKSKKWIQSLVE